VKVIKTINTSDNVILMPKINVNRFLLGYITALRTKKQEAGTTFATKQDPKDKIFQLQMVRPTFGPNTTGSLLCKK
jgi:hypothetical protein